MTVNNLYPLLLLFTYEDSEISLSSFLSANIEWQLRACSKNDINASKGNFQIKSGTVSETVSVTSNRGTEWRLFERVCHTLPVVCEASCSIPDIGTLRHERRVCDDRRMLQSNLWAKGANESHALCRAFLVLFAASKSTERKTWKITNDKSSKVKIIRRTEMWKLRLSESSLCEAKTENWKLKTAVKREQRKRLLLLCRAKASKNL